LFWVLRVERMLWSSGADQLASTTASLAVTACVRIQEGRGFALLMMDISAMARTRSFAESLTATYWAVRALGRVRMPSVSRPSAFIASRAALPVLSTFSKGV